MLLLPACYQPVTCQSGTYQSAAQLQSGTCQTINNLRFKSGVWGMGSVLNVPRKTTLNLTCSIDDGQPPPKYYWKTPNNETIETEDERLEVPNIGGMSLRIYYEKLYCTTLRLLTITKEKGCYKK